MSTLVSLGGAFLKSSRVPAIGSTLNLREVYTQQSADLFLKGEVIWAIDKPTLEQPDTGFGIRFLEMYTRGDPRILEEFLGYLDPTFGSRDPPDIYFEERSIGVCAVFRFDDALSLPDTEPPKRVATEDPPSLDLARELDRLQRHENRQAVSVAPEPPQRRRRSRRRSVTGLFTALFSRSGTEGASPDAEPPRVRDVRGPRMTVASDSRQLVCEVARLTPSEVTLRTREEAPTKGEAVVLRPLGTPTDIGQLRIHGTVTSINADERGQSQRFNVSFGRIEEGDAGAGFDAYLRLVNGPGDTS